jgi:hypothetical protein
MTNDAKRGLTIVVCFFGMIVCGFYYCYYLREQYNKICIKKEIKTIGGCNSYGVCRVKFKDNTIGMVSYPLVGEASCQVR